MRIIKAMAHGLIVALLGIVVFAMIALLTVGLNVTNREVVKSWPSEAGVYNNVPARLLSLVKLENGHTLEANIDAGLLDAQRLKTVLGGVFPAAYFEEKVEAIIDPMYDWLEGKADELVFEVSLSDKSQELATALDKEVRTQLADAPVCSSNQSPEDFDILRAKCLPRGVSADQAAQEVTKQLTGKKSPLAQAEFSSEKLELDAETEQRLPQEFDRLKTVMWVLPVVAGVLVVLAGLTGKNSLFGFRRVGQTLFSIGALSWIGFYVTKYMSDRFTSIKSDDEQAQVLFAEVVNPLLKSVVNSLTGTGMWVTLTVIVVGILIWLATFFWHKVHHEPDSSKSKSDNPTLPKPIKPAAKS